MSGIGPCLIFLFLAPIIFVALIAFDSAKKMKPEQDNSSHVRLSIDRCTATYV